MTVKMEQFKEGYALIELRSDFYRVTEIRTKTKAHMFQDIQVGDVLQFKLDMKHTGYASRGTYATYVKVINHTKNDSTVKSQSEMSNILSRTFVLERINATSSTV